jgi:hypothetical protein
MKLLQWITSLFTSWSYQDQLDRFVASKCPTSTADVEHWLKAYNQNQRGWSL